MVSKFNDSKKLIKAKYINKINYIMCQYKTILVKYTCLRNS